MVRFNNPPTWPQRPDDWRPGPEWEPDPSWPPAPPGWQFWSDEVPSAAHDDAAQSGRCHRARPFIIATALIAVVLLIVGTVVAFNRAGNDRQQQPAALDTPLTFVPNHPAPISTTFADWTPFGGIDAAVSQDGSTVVLDTHDTVETWDTKWSGLELGGAPTCSMRVTGRVRSISHTPGIAGGFGIGLGTLHGAAGSETLTGAAVQFDAGQQGYRLADYPADGDSGLVPAMFGHDWRTIDLTIKEGGAVKLKVDGRTVVDARLTDACGRPVIRVWAGSAEFADFKVEE